VSLERSFVVNGADIVVSGDLQGFELDIKARETADGITLATITLSRGAAAPPPQLTLKWSIPSNDISGIWAPGLGPVVGPDWAKESLRSTLTSNAPVLTLFGRNERNRMTVAVADALNPIKLAARLREEDLRIYNSIELFAEPHKAVTRYSTEIRFDSRPLPFYTVLKDVTGWWETHDGYAPAPVPADASEPIDSTWYSYHQNVPFDLMIAEADQAAKLGLKVMIVDDGWQTKDDNRGYGFTGDWQPERLRDMKGFTDALHARGLKGMLWFSVPFVGDKSAAHERFKGKFLSHDADLQSNVLDPRYPEVRAYLIETFRRAVEDWGWDGLKLDFIDTFKSNNQTILEVADGRDYASVYEAVDRLMGDIMTDLRRINPDVMIEFRQPYTGPPIRKYGNMLRASDTPNGSIVNRQRIADLRLLSGTTPVHADPIVWSIEEPVEIAAFQLLDTLFGVPQISMRLDKLPLAHAAMVKNYLRYWRENRPLLLAGEFQPEGIFGRYALIGVSTPEKRIVALYEDRVVRLEGASPAKIDIINAKGSGRVLLDIVSDLGGFDLLIADCQGVVQSRRRIDLRKGAHAIDVPISGIAALTRMTNSR
jgi:alpha-galactosidase